MSYLTLCSIIYNYRYSSDIFLFILHTLHTLSTYPIDIQINSLVYAVIIIVYVCGLFLLFHQILFAAADSAMLEFWHIPEETAKG